ncbi:uncharacterized protein A4U43_C01F28530 [Asparagus officinalis]|uniref:Uncharacterized protein n=1 Tax=Asparagus officinalis TaxID=4686 RepID=A0A5P1FVB2_ASPOF|nr:uncharacterized protein A4U43_C01F28530 [Asparagus officinalis]
MPSYSDLDRQIERLREQVLSEGGGEGAIRASDVDLDGGAECSAGEVPGSLGAGEVESGGGGDTNSISWEITHIGCRGESIIQRIG